MPVYEVAVPAGSKNIMPDGMRIVYRHSKDGAVPVILLFGGDNFQGNVLEGQWIKGQSGGSFTTKVVNGLLEMKGKSDVAGTSRDSWINSQVPLLIVDDVVIDVHVKVGEVTPTYPFAIQFFLIPSQVTSSPLGQSDYLKVLLFRSPTAANTIEVVKRKGGSDTLLFAASMPNKEGTFRVKLYPSSKKMKIFYHDGAGDVNETTDELPLASDVFDFLVDKAYPAFLFSVADTTVRTVNSDFVKVTYPAFEISYDLPGEERSGEGVELLKKAYDTAGINDGEIYGAKWIKDGKYGKALSFDGVDDYVEVGDVCRFEGTAPFSVAFWVFDSGFTGQSDRLVSKEDISSPVQGWYVQRNLSVNTYVLWRQQAGVANAVAINYTPNQWNFVAFTYDGNTMRGYLNGEFKASATSTLSIQPVAYPLRFGRASNSTYFFKGKLDEVRIYNRALTQEEIVNVMNNNPPSNGLVAEYRFDGGNSRGDVVVYDTVGETDESKWNRVYVSDHVFKGQCVIENGLVRFRCDPNADNYPTYGIWNGKWIENNFNMPSGKRQVRELAILKMSNEEVIVKFKGLKFYLPDEFCQVRIKRGNLYLEIQNLGPSVHDVYYYFPSSRFSYADASLITDDNLLTDWQLINRNKDNVVFRFGGKLTISEGRTENYDSQKQTSTYGFFESVQVNERIFLGYNVFPFYSNLFKEAENATLSAGATIVTSLSDDSGDSVALDGQGEYVRYSITDVLKKLPIGRYWVFIRAKDTAHITNDFKITVYNLTDSRHLNEDRASVLKTLTASFAYYGVVFDLTNDDSGDSIYIEALKNTTGVNTIYVDYFIIVPMGKDDMSYPQDLCHNALRDVESKFRLVRRT